MGSGNSKAKQEPVPEYIQKFFDGNTLDEAKIELCKNTFTSDASVEFIGKFAPKGPGGKNLVIPSAGVPPVLGLLSKAFPDFQFNKDKATFKKRKDGGWSADIVVRGKHTGEAFTPLPGKLPPVPTSNIEASIGPERFTLYFNSDGKCTRQTIEPLHEGPSGPPGFYVLVGGKMPTGASALDNLSESEKETAKKLIELGLPESQAIQSAKALTAGANPSPSPSTFYGVLTINEDADRDALKTAFTAYSKASKGALGKVMASYGMSEKEVYFVEAYNSPNAMDAHIAVCFEHYVKMLPHCKMTELVGSVEPSEVEWWKNSAGAWGASKFIVSPHACSGGCTGNNDGALNQTPTDLTLDSLSDAEKETANKLTGLGLPEKQALLSAKALSEGTKASSTHTAIYFSLTVNDDADQEALKTAFTNYANAAKGAHGKLHAAYSITEKEINSVEFYNSPCAMDAHVAVCFEHYVKVLAHTKPGEIVVVNNESESEWWKQSAGAWGAPKFVVTPSI